MVAGTGRVYEPERQLTNQILTRVRQTQAIWAQNSLLITFSFALPNCQARNVFIKL